MEYKKIKSFTDLEVWRKAHKLVICIYMETKTFPKEELFGLSSQLRRAVVSITSNIAEGFHRFHHKEKQQFLAIAFGSGSELESQIEIAKVLFTDLKYKRSMETLTEVMKMLNKMLSRKLESRK